MTTITGEPPSPWSGLPSGRDEPGWTTPSSTAAAPTPTHSLPIVFQGSGSEYFRIWIVNLLLTLATLGLYYPWAKARRLRYFYGNTFVGEHALDFHGDPKLMLRGFLIAVLLAIGYSVAGKVSPMAGLVAFVVLAIVWPAMFWTSQRFRLANTSWRGLRFHFSGSLGGAYAALLPLFVPSLLIAATAAFAGDMVDETVHPGRSALLLMPVFVLLIPLALWLLKRYQHGHFNLGQVRTELRTGAGSFYLVALKVIGVTFLASLLAGIATAILVGAWRGYAGRAGLSMRDLRSIVFAVVGFLVIYGSVLLFAYPYITSRLQNLVWGRTQSRDIRFGSDLRYWPLLWLTWKNLLLVLVTLGFYAPFARIATARLRLQAVSVQTSLAPDELVAGLRDNDRPGAAGDAAGDLLGFDIGW